MKVGTNVNTLKPYYFYWLVGIVSFAVLIVLICCYFIFKKFILAKPGIKRYIISVFIVLIISFILFLIGIIFWSKFILPQVDSRLTYSSGFIR